MGFIEAPVRISDSFADLSLQRGESQVSRALGRNAGTSWPAPPTPAS